MSFWGMGGETPPLPFSLAPKPLGTWPAISLPHPCPGSLYTGPIFLELSSPTWNLWICTSQPLSQVALLAVVCSQIFNNWLSEQGKGTSIYSTCQFSQCTSSHCGWFPAAPVSYEEALTSRSRELEQACWLPCIPTLLWGPFPEPLR